MMWLRQRIRAFWLTPTSCVNLAVCRILFYGALLICYFRFDYGWYADVPEIFWRPTGMLRFFGMTLVDSAYLDVLQWSWKLSLFLSAIGLATRVSTRVAFLLGIYLIGTTHSFGITCHYDGIHVLLLAVMALARCGDAISVDVLLRRRRFRDQVIKPAFQSAEYTWPIRLACLLLALMYFSAGFSKLRVSGIHWFTSDFLAHLLVWHQYVGAPTEWAPYLARVPWLCNLLAFLVVVVELSVPLALLSRRCGLLLVPAAYCLHVAIYVLIGPQFLHMITCYVFWVPWQQVFSAVISAGTRRPPDGISQSRPQPEARAA